MNPRLRPHLAVFELNTSLLLAVLQDVRADRGWVLTVGTAGMPGIAVHVLDARNFLAQLLSVEMADPLLRSIRGAKRVEDLGTVPSPASIASLWLSLSRRVRPVLQGLPDEALDAPAPQEFPVSDGSFLGAVAFLLQHEAYHIGQLSVLRRAAGHPPVPYASRADLW